MSLSGINDPFSCKSRTRLVYNEYANVVTMGLTKRASEVAFAQHNMSE